MSNRRISPARRSARALVLPLVIAAAVFVSPERARAQASGVTQQALPNVMLLVDTSGSMERMFDGSLPSAVATTTTTVGNACLAGSQSNPNRWGSLVQALTGNMQPYYSCDAISRSGTAFLNEFSILTKPPLDKDYALPYHRPLTGGTSATACALAPTKLPGSGVSWGAGRVGAGGDASDFPDDALTGRDYTTLKSNYAGGSPSLTSTTCTFEQARDGQLDASRDYVRFGLMTFDNELNEGIGLSSSALSWTTGNAVGSDPFLGSWSYIGGGAAAKGNPDKCGPANGLLWEVGARHFAAPPWEGRMVRFPAWDASLLDVQRTNEEVQKVLIGTRPYGATPIDGMLADAYHYLVSSSEGPTVKDQYVANGCRQQYVVLLTDGAPNLNMRPSCEGTTGSPTGNCPFPKALDRAKDLYDKNIPVYVIGFSVNGENTTSDGFPSGTYAPDAPPKRTCRDWIAKHGASAIKTNVCDVPGSRPAAGTTAEACCVLNEIALAGSGGASPAYFAESQADLVLAFGRVVGGVARDASTRTVPATSPAVNFTDAATGTKIRSGQFVASFIPSAQRVWSGEIDRTRTYCDGATPTPQAQSVSDGDSYAANLAQQNGTSSSDRKRLVFTAVPKTDSNFDSAGSLRPWTAATPADGLTDWKAEEAFEPPTASGSSLLSGQFSGGNFAKMLGVSSSTCKRTRISKGGSVDVYPPLGADDCADVAWAFATARPGTLNKTGAGLTRDFNVRCSAGGTGNENAGTCVKTDPTTKALTSVSCTMNASTAGVCDPGSVCVPLCSALGAIFRSNPVVVGPPDGLIRDDGYRAFAQERSLRRPTLFVATTDGILHAFKALDAGKPEDVVYELWGFVPPAVLPNLASNFPTGQQILFDGSPVVKDVVWNRKPGVDADAKQWKTSLVASLGFGGGGYFSLNVTDVDCGGLKTPDACIAASNGFAKAGSFDEASNAGVVPKPGPHFMWQLTDVPCKPGCSSTDDLGIRVRKDTSNLDRIGLFGSQTTTPAITTVQIEVSGEMRQVGVAILPGGISGAPAKGGFCERAVTTAGYAATTYAVSTATYRNNVRRWGSTCTAKVPGRSLTVVRLDNGEILRHFVRSEEAPGVLSAVTTKAAFDSPVTGTPVVFPNVLGTPAQKAFVGDADGTIWRLDVTDKNPSNWTVKLFHDAVTLTGSPSQQAQADASQPISVPIVLSTDPTGDPVLHVATGDQENMVAVTGLKNWVVSVSEKAAKPQVNWTLTLDDSERVTGPMAVFDRTLYMATYLPKVPATGQCNQPGVPYLWGMDYLLPEGTTTAAGGLKRWCDTTSAGLSNVDSGSGTCTGTVSQKQQVVGLYTVIPGVAVQQSLACSAQSGGGDPAYTGFSATEYRLVFGTAQKNSTNASGAVAQAGRQSLRIARPGSPARIDAWAYVTD